jgi:hypothetical protein
MVRVAARSIFSGQAWAAALLWLCIIRVKARASSSCSWWEL